MIRVEIAYAIRKLLRKPSFLAPALFTLALGSAAVMSIFSVVDAVMLQRLPFHDADRLYQLEGSRLGQPAWLTYANLQDLQIYSKKTIQTAAIIDLISIKTPVNGHWAQLDVMSVSASWFSVIGAKPARGRDFVSDEDLPGKPHVLILSDSVWRRDFAADPKAIGRLVNIRGDSYTIVGVMPPGFSLPPSSGREAWSPASISSAQRASHSGTNVLSIPTGLVRINSGNNEVYAQTILQSVQSEILRDRPNEELPDTLRITRYLSYITRSVSKPLLLLQFVGVLFWLLSCFNTSSLLVLRSVSREREFAIHYALGASTLRVITQVAIESFSLSCVGCLSGLLIGCTVVKEFWKPISTSIPMSGSVHLDTWLLSTLSVLVLVTWFLIGFVPSLKAANTDMQRGLRRSVAPRRLAGLLNLNSTLIVGQLAITMTLLCAAGLLVNTVIGLRRVPLGFSERNILTAGLLLPSPAHPADRKATPRDVVSQIYDPLLDRLTHTPGIESAALGSALPMRSDFEMTLDGDIDGLSGPDSEFAARGRIASPELTKTFGIPLISGRFFDVRDTHGSLPVVVVNQAFVDRFMNGSIALDHTLGVSTGKFSKARIIGVIGNVKQGDVTLSTEPEVYLCLGQVDPTDSFYEGATALMQVAIRSRIPAEQMKRQLEVALNQISPATIVTNVKTIHDIVTDSFGDSVLLSNLLEGFSCVALVISAMGLYSSVNFYVAQRRRDIGIRLAIGVPPKSVFKMVMWQAISPVLIGILVGSLSFWFLGRLIQAYLFGVGPHDLRNPILAAFGLACSGIIAGLSPARRAMTVDPMESIRAE